jgi:hypothetical protein
MEADREAGGQGRLRERIPTVAMGPEYLDTTGSMAGVPDGRNSRGEGGAGLDNPSGTAGLIIRGRIPTTRTVAAPAPATTLGRDSHARGGSQAQNTTGSVAGAPGGRNKRRGGIAGDVPGGKSGIDS